MREQLKKKHNRYWVYEYGAVIPFIYDCFDDDGEPLGKRREIHKGHIGREELEEYIEVLEYALKKRKEWEKSKPKRSEKCQ